MSWKSKNNFKSARKLLIILITESLMWPIFIFLNISLGEPQLLHVRDRNKSSDFKNSYDYKSVINHKIAQGIINWYRLWRMITNIILAPFFTWIQVINKGSTSQQASVPFQPAFICSTSVLHTCVIAGTLSSESRPLPGLPLDLFS